MIDDAQEVQQLLRDLQTQLPIRARSTPELARLLQQQQGMSLRPDQEIQITSVLYLGDMGGIACGLEQLESGRAAVVTSLTHLRVDENHPLSDRIQAYQRRRSARIAGPVRQARPPFLVDPRLRRKERKKLRNRRK